MLVTEKFVVTLHNSDVSALETIQEHNRTQSHRNATSRWWSCTRSWTR